MIDASLVITCLIVSVQGSVVDTHIQKLTSKVDHATLRCQVKEGVARVALMSKETEK